MTLTTNDSVYRMTKCILLHHLTSCTTWPNIPRSFHQVDSACRSLQGHPWEGASLPDSSPLKVHPDVNFRPNFGPWMAMVSICWTWIHTTSGDPQWQIQLSNSPVINIATKATIKLIKLQALPFCSHPRQRWSHWKTLGQRHNARFGVSSTSPCYWSLF